MARFLSTKEEIIGLFYLRHLIEKKFNVQKLEDRHFEKIAKIIDEGENTSSKRTIGRLFNFENKIGNRMVKKITEIIKWYYDDRKKNFDNFLEIEKTNIDNFYKVVDFRIGNEDSNETQRKLDNFFEEIEQYFDEKTNTYKFPKEKENKRVLKNTEHQHEKIDKLEQVIVQLEELRKSLEKHNAQEFLDAETYNNIKNYIHLHGTEREVKRAYDKIINDKLDALNLKLDRMVNWENSFKISLVINILLFFTSVPTFLKVLALLRRKLLLQLEKENSHFFLDENFDEDDLEDSDANDSSEQGDSDIENPLLL